MKLSEAHLNINRHICYLEVRRQFLVRQNRPEDAAVISLESKSFNEFIKNKSNLLAVSFLEDGITEIIRTHD